MDDEMQIDGGSAKRARAPEGGDQTSKKTEMDVVESVGGDGKVDFLPSPVHSMRVASMSIGEVNRVPLIVCKTGSRVWSRRRDPPHSLEYADITPDGELQAWNPVTVDEEKPEVYGLGDCESMPMLSSQSVLCVFS